MALVAVKRALSPKACSAARRGAGHPGGTGDGTGAGADLGESAGEAGAIGLGDGSGAEGVTCTSSSSEPFSS